MSVARPIILIVDDELQNHRLLELPLRPEINEMACRMLGYTREELLLKGPCDISIATADENSSMVFDRLKAKTGTSELVVIRMQHKDGSSFLAEINRQAHLSAGVWMIIAVARDVTERT